MGPEISFLAQAIQDFRESSIDPCPLSMPRSWLSAMKWAKVRNPPHSGPDAVELASKDSFPCSDAPSWTITQGA